MAEKRLMTIKETAEYIGFDAGTIRNWIFQKKCPFRIIKAGKRKILVDVNDVDAWIESMKEEQKTANGEAAGS